MAAAGAVGAAAVALGVATAGAAKEQDERSNTDDHNERLSAGVHDQSSIQPAGDDKASAQDEVKEESGLYDDQGSLQPIESRGSHSARSTPTVKTGGSISTQHTAGQASGPTNAEQMHLSKPMNRVVSFDRRSTGTPRSNKWNRTTGPEWGPMVVGSTPPSILNSDVGGAPSGSSTLGSGDKTRQSTSYACASASAGKDGKQRQFQIYEYDEEGDARVMYGGFGDPDRLQLCRFDATAMPRARRETDEVIVKVQASTVSYTDCLIRRGMWWGKDSVPLPTSPGVDFIGTVSDCGEHVLKYYGLKMNDRVASLCQWGGNSRFLKASAHKLVKVPVTVDAVAAACLLETYLAAFQSLHQGQSAPYRYRKDALLGKSILIIGGIAMVGQAAVELALNAGADAVYVTAKDKHHEFLRSIGAIPLDLHPDDWLPLVKDEIDLLFDPFSAGDYNTAFLALNSTGRLVCSGEKLVEEENDFFAKANELWAKTKFQSRIIAYDVFESWEDNFGSCKNDLIHLFDLLSMGILDVPIADTVPLSKVKLAHTQFELRRIQGFIVCEPWLKQKKKALYM